MSSQFQYEDHTSTSAGEPVSSGSNWSQVYSGQAMYVDEPGDTGAVSPMDIAQGQIGDCFFLAALGELIIKDPDYLYGVIAGNAGGGETVQLYQDAAGGPVHTGSTQHFVATAFQVDNAFSPDAVNNYNTSDIVDGVKEIWPQVMEKAYAEDYGDYAQISNGGYDSDAMETLTGHKAAYQGMASVTMKELKKLWNNPNSMVTLDTPDTPNLPDGILSNHAYMLAGLVNQGGQTLVSLLNPWGDHEPALLTLAQVKTDFTGLTHGTV